MHRLAINAQIGHDSNRDLDHASAAVAGQALQRECARHWAPVDLDFCVDNLDAALTRTLGAGTVLEGPPRD